MDKKYDLICDQCGGMMKFNEDKTEMHCEYCGNIVILPDKEQDAKVAYAKRKAELEAQHSYYEKRKRKERRHLNLSKLIALLVVAGIFLIPASCVGVVWLCRPTVNPFDYIEVSFKGVDGEGKVVVELVKSDDNIKNTNDLGLEVSPDRNLSEGDTVTVYAKSLESGYRFSESKRQYTVEGLELYLTDLNDMDDNVIELIHRKSEQLVGMVIEDKPQITDVEHEKFYLLSDGEQENLLYDVYKATWELADGTDKTIYLVAYYENIITHNGDNATFSYESAMYTGSIISTSSYQNGVVTAFESLEDIELDLNTNRSPEMVLSER